MVACTESETGGDEPTPQPQKPSITIDSNTLSSFTEDGGKGTISFTASEAWTAEVINTRADSWVSIHPTSGGAGEANITVTTEPNDTPDDRSATIVIKSGTVEKTVKISQKQQDALTVTAATFEVGNEGGEIDIEVKANIDFEYEIDEAAKEWIEYKGTRAIETSTLTFAVAENDDVEKREAKINIKSGEFNETITIYQAGAEPTLVISQSEYAVPSVGETIVVEVASNVDVTVELPADADWISESTTRSVSTNTFYFDIAANEEYDQRTAEIKFSNADKGLSEVVTIVQAQKDAIVIAEDSYSVSGQGDAIEIAVGHNVEFDIEIDVDWISQSQTRALETSTLIFNVAQNETDAERSGTITFTSKDNDEISQVITVKQEAGASKIYYTSTDGNIVKPKDGTDWGGAQIVSNTYENGQGVITFDGVVTKIGKYAFQKCATLASITIPEGVTSIEGYAFCECSALTSASLPESVTEIGSHVFEFCNKLAEVNIPESVTAIGDYAFTWCESLTSITIPEGVTAIKNGTFNICSSLANITIPEGVTSIGGHAFSQCPKLTEITLPESVTSIGSQAFASCGALRSINIPKGITEINDRTFSGCFSLTDVIIPEGVTSIGEYAFSSCSSLTSIVIPEGVTSIGNYAFNDCRKATSITIPSSITTIERYVFAGCWGVTSINIPEGVVSIGGAAFYNCRALQTITLPKSLTTINERVFDSCRSLTDITIPESVTTFGGGVFANCEKLTNINIPKSITKIGVQTFQNCKALTNIVLPEGLTEIGEYAFTKCESLTSIILPESVTTIGKIAFDGCNKLTSINIPSSMTSIGQYAFSGCGITSVTIPEWVTSIGDYAFRYCYKLAEVNCKPTTPPTLGNGAFDQNASNRKIIVPYTAVADYKAASGWSAYANFIEGINPDAPNQQGTLPVLNKESIASKIAGEFDRGGEGVGYHDLSGRNGGTPDVNGQGGIGYTTSGEWLAYTIYVEDAGTYKFTMYGASALGNAGTYSGEYQWYLNDPNVAENALGPRFHLQNSGSWAGPGAPSESVEFELSEGYQRIIFYIHNGSHELYNFTAEWVE